MTTGPETINVAYIAERCAQDWGLFHDVMKNLELCRARVGDYGLSESDVERIQSNLATARGCSSGDRETPGLAIAGEDRYASPLAQRRRAAGLE